MIRQNHYLNNILVREPANWREMSVELNFDRDKTLQKQTLTVTEWEMVQENNDTINRYINDGTGTGPGVFEGLPWRVEVERGNSVEKIFDGYLDFTQSEFGRIKSTLKGIELNGIDWFNDAADGFTFEHLYKDIGSITDTDFIKVPYIINSVPNYVEAAVGVISVYVMVKEVKDVIQRIAEFVAELPIYYVFSTYIKLILYIIYLILLIIALIKLVKNVVLLLIQPVKYHSAMKVKTLFEKGFEHLGFTFKSPIFDEYPWSEMVHIPAKYYNPVNNKEKQILGISDPALTKEGYYKGTFGQFCRDYKTLFNGKFMFKGNEAWFVRRDYTTSSPKYKLPAVLPNKSDENKTFRLNTDEFNANTYIHFAIDYSEKNTIQEYQGTSYQVILKPARIINQNMVLMKGLNDISIPFSLAKIKNDLTVPEQILDGFLKVFNVIMGALVTVVNAVITVLNLVIALVNDVLNKLATIGIKIKFRLPPIPTVKLPDFGNLMKNRKGMMKLETDIISVSKVAILKLGTEPKFHKLDPDNHHFLSASYIYHHFYYIDSFYPSDEKPNGNQYLLPEPYFVPFTWDDFQKVKTDNVIETADGKEAEVEYLKWNPHHLTAEIKVRINHLYTNNLIQTTYEPNGQ